MKMRCAGGVFVLVLVAGPLYGQVEKCSDFNKLSISLQELTSEWMAGGFSEGLAYASARAAQELADADWTTHGVSGLEGLTLADWDRFMIAALTPRQARVGALSLEIQVVCEEFPDIELGPAVWLAADRLLLISGGGAAYQRPGVAELRPGMTREEVRQKLGEPRTNVPMGGGLERWTYYGYDSQGQISARTLIIFGTDGRIIEINDL